MRCLTSVAIAVVAGSLLTGQTLPPDLSRKPPVVRLAPEAQQKLFLLPDGYRIEPVLTDPVIQDPVGVTFDGNGRMYVLEMRSYMQDADGTNSRAPISRISRHEDTNADGTFDKHTVFIDDMVMPRIAFPLEDGVILALETDNRDLFKYSDTNDDGVADKKELFYSGYGRVTNMEWQPGGMTWALDNWLYAPYNPFRLRITAEGKVIREETDVNGGQWGVNQDNYGKTWFVDGGSETGPVNFQAPIVYGAFNVPDNFEPDFQVPWPAPGGIADMQGGMARVRMPDHRVPARAVKVHQDHPDGKRGDDRTMGDWAVARLSGGEVIIRDERLDRIHQHFQRLPGGAEIKGRSPLRDGQLQRHHIVQPHLTLRVDVHHPSPRARRVRD